MNRRKFLRTLLGAGAATAACMLDNPFRPMIRLARAAEGKTLVVVFQRGGCDGLNMVVPYGDPFYKDLRPTIAIAPPDLSDNESALDLDGFFGLHPSLFDLLNIWTAGDLAIMPAVQYPNASRSHFDGQHFIESAASRADRSNKDNLDGWLNRHLASHPQTGQLRAVSFGSSVAQALRGPMSVSSFSDLARFDLGFVDDAPEKELLENELLDRLGPIYSQPLDPDAIYRQLLQESGGTVINNLSVVKNIDDTSSYEPENGAIYPSNGYGGQLKQIAQLIKTPGVGLEMATVNIGGWDTHSNQGGGGTEGRQARRFQDYAAGIRALYTDLGSQMSDVIILSMTEFGRTSKENGSFGTDHGHGACWLVVGGGGTVSGGIYGEWPGLGPFDLYRGRYLAHTVDYRNVLAEILTGFMGNLDLSVVYTGSESPDSPTDYRPVGFLA